MVSQGVIRYTSVIQLSRGTWGIFTSRKSDGGLILDSNGQIWHFKAIKAEYSTKSGIVNNLMENGADRRKCD